MRALCPLAPLVKAPQEARATSVTLLDEDEPEHPQDATLCALDPAGPAAAAAIRMAAVWPEESLLLTGGRMSTYGATTTKTTITALDLSGR